MGTIYSCSSECGPQFTRTFWYVRIVLLSCVKKISDHFTQNCTDVNLDVPDILLYCICYTIWIDWHLIFGLEQEGGSLIAPMGLAHPLHPIDNRSRNRRRNLWVGWCVSSWWPLFPSRSSVLIYIYIYMLFYMSSVFFGLPIVSCSLIIV